MCAVDLPGARLQHLSMGTSDPVGHAPAIDALDHRGPAQQVLTYPHVPAEPALAAYAR